MRSSSQRSNRLGKLVKSKRLKQRDRERRVLNLESLEDRRVMAGPELIAIRPDQGALLAAGDVLKIAPREFNLLFKGGASIDPTTISSGVRLVRANHDGFGNGNDVTVSLGFLGLSDATNPVQIVMRPASSAQDNTVSNSMMFPDDDYRIEILPALQDTSGNAFNSGRAFSMTFTLDLGAQVIAVVPQPITRSGSVLQQARNQIVVYFDDQNLNATEATDPSYYRVVDLALTSNESGGTKDKILLPESVAYDSATNSATLTFASDLAEGTYRVEIGHSDEPNNSLAGAISVGTLTAGSPFSYLSYLGDGSGTNKDASDVDMYKVNLRAGTSVSVTVAPREATLDTKLRLLDSNGANVGAAVFTDGGAGANDTLTYTVPVGGGGDYFLEVKGSGGVDSVGSYLLTISGGSAVPTSDVNSSFAQAATNSNLGVLGANSVAVSAQIQPQSILLPQYPGSIDEPGHRDTQTEAHVSGDYGIGPTTPGSIGVIGYSFPTLIGSDGAGNPYRNLITEREKELVREIFDVISSYCGLVFGEMSAGGMMVAKGDLRALDPGATNGPGGVAGLGGGGGVVLDALEGWTSDVWGGDFFGVMIHELGHAVGLGHSYDQLSMMGGGITNGVYPGDYDVVHLQRVWRPDATDIDLYQFTLENDGTFTAETTAERQNSNLNSVLTLFDANHNVIARNDDYYGNDSFMNVPLSAGTYYIGVTSVGNTEYDPTIADTGSGGRTDGAYKLTLGFTPSENGSALTDVRGTAIDGDANGTPGGTYNFWFESSDRTIFVDKLADSHANQVDGTGTLADPYDTISAALSDAARRVVVPQTGGAGISNNDYILLSDGITATKQITFKLGAGVNTAAIAYFNATDSASVVAASLKDSIDKAFGIGSATISSTRVVKLSSNIVSLDVTHTPSLLNTPNIVRIVGNGGLDGSLSTLSDNRPYLVGFDNSRQALPDGSEFLVPQGTTVMIDGGALFKMRGANLDAGTTATGINRNAGAIQMLGTPSNSVYLRSLRDDTVGGDSDGIGPAAGAGDFGGIVYRSDSDMEDPVLVENCVYLNYVGQTNIKHGGGKVSVDSVESVYEPIHMVEARPTVQFNVIGQSAGAAVSANPDSFDDSHGRIGPDVHGNYLTGNTMNGLFIRIETELGSTLDELTVNGRWNDTDITHVLTESLEIAGNPGGRLDGTARPGGRLMIDPGVVVKINDSRIELERGQSNLIAEGTKDRPIIFTSVRDDRFGGSGSFDATGNGASTGAAGDWAGILLNHFSHASIDQARIAFGGGDAPTEGAADYYDVIEVHQANLRLTTSVIENSGSGGSNTDRNGRGQVPAATIYAIGSQPVLVNNIIQNNASVAVSINANSLKVDTNRDPGRATGLIDDFSDFADNHGPLVRLNKLSNNGINGMEVRAEELTVESVWDDTDITHVLRGEILVNNHHTYSGVRLQSSSSESLIVKLSGANAGFTANGELLDIDDRIGGTVQILGTVGHPVILTSLADDTVGAGFTPQGRPVLDTNGNGAATSPFAGSWRSILLDRYSNDRNVEVVRELESVFTNRNDVNSAPNTAQYLGVLSPDKRDESDSTENTSQKFGDENSRLGFQVNGFISTDDPTDADVYSFTGTAGTEIWIDIDRTDPSLDVIVELINASGTLLARSTDMPEALGTTANPTGSANPQPLAEEPLLGGDYYSTNRLDAGMRLTLPGMYNTKGTYFVRVRSTPSAGNINDIDGGLTTGEYQLQIRMQQRDEKPGSVVRYADIRYATTGIDVRGLPAHSPLLAESGEVAVANDVRSSSQTLGNLMTTDIGALGWGGSVNTGSSGTDVDWYVFDLNQTQIQSIAGINSMGKTVSLVFDLDYADGAVRPDASISVFDSNGELIFVGRESNIANDQPASNQSPDTDDLLRGSLGARDAFIGPVHIPVGTPAGGKLTYYVAISSDRMQTPFLNAYFSADPDPVFFANDPEYTTAMLTRLEPVNSVKRVVEDHVGFQGYSSNGSDIAPTTTDGIFDITTKTALDAQVIPFTLADVALYVITDSSSSGSSNDDVLYTVNPYAGGSVSQGLNVTRVSSGEVSGGNNDVQDIVMRSDGVLYGYRRMDNSSSTVGQRVIINQDTGVASDAGSDNIPDRSPVPNYPTGSTNPTQTLFRDLATTDYVDALTYVRLGRGTDLGSAPNYDLYYAVRETDTGVSPQVNSKLYRADASSGSAARGPKSGANDYYGELGDIQPAGVTFASTTASFVDNGNPQTITATVRVESKVPGAQGSFTLTINRGDFNGNSIATGGAGALTLNLDTNPLATPQDMVNLINNNTEARKYFVADIVSGSASGDSTNGPGGTYTATGSDGFGSAILGLDRPLQGYVTGMAFDNFSNTAVDRFWAVTSAGEFVKLDPNTGDVLKRFDFGNSPDFSFQGLTLGPQNVEGGIYKNLVFAISGNGRIYAIDTDAAEAAPNVLTPTSILENVFSGGASFTTIAGLPSKAVGLAFSPLDFNMWHPTTKRASDSGHGINVAPDNSRAPTLIDSPVVDPEGVERDSNQGEGGASFYFGLERSEPTLETSDNVYLTYTPGENSQLGILNQEVQSDLSSNAAIANTYNLPAGGYGKLLSSDFSLSGYDSKDKPTLYFNYFLNTEAYGGTTGGSNVGSDGTNPFRDSARVFISTNGGTTWELVASNNSQLSAGDVGNASGQAELPSFLSHNNDAALNSDGARPEKRQQVQELFDSTGEWRQARVDLSTYAGQANLRLRFDFSTAGSMNDSSLTIAGTASTLDGTCTTTGDKAVFGEFCSSTRSIRSLNNQYEGFYVDDIIVGFAERGEMVTGGPQATRLGDPTTFSDLQSGRTSRENDPNANPDNYVGDYQVEVRRSGEYAGLNKDGSISVGMTYDTNDAHIITPLTVAPNGFSGFEQGTLNGDMNFVSPPTVPITVGTTTIDWSAPVQDLKWKTDTTTPLHGTYAATTNAWGGGMLGDRVAGLELTKTYAQAGAIQFAYRVNATSENDGLYFLIDGVPQKLAGMAGEPSTQTTNPFLATGDIPYFVATFSVSSGTHVFTWAAANIDQSSPQVFIDDVSILIGGTGLTGDQNKARAQGQLILDSNFITNSATTGINVQAGDPDANGNDPHPGSLIRFVPQNQNRLAPGVVIQNNVIAWSGQTGISFAGDSSGAPDVAFPFGRILNNTIYGGSHVGTGISISNTASPTTLNNLLAGLAVGISGGTSSGAVTRSNFFQDNSSNGNVGSESIQESNASAPLFVNAAARNFYLQAGSQAIDSSLNLLQDRATFVSFKNVIGMLPSPILAPERDVYGQLRVDDPTADPLGAGSVVYKDRGAVDKADSELPYAELLVPLDNDASGEDLDPNSTVVYRLDKFLGQFTILLSDGAGPNAPFQGTGVDPTTVNASSVSIRQDRQLLVAGKDYTLGYNAASNLLLLTPLSSLWQPNQVYVVTLDNTQITDLAGNPLRLNQPDGTTKFTIILGDAEFDYGDAPNVSYGTDLASNGARHVQIANAPVYFGTGVDTETDGNPGVTALGDDNSNSDDEDGVSIGRVFLPNTASTNDVQITVTATVPLDPTDSTKLLVPALVDGWIDFNRNGLFETAEKLKLKLNGKSTNAIDAKLDLDSDPTTVTNRFTITVDNTGVNPPITVPILEGLTYARFRLSPDGGLSPTGLGIGGEVEDYAITIVSNSAPTVATPLGTLDVLEDAATVEIDLTNPNIFDDADLHNGNGDSLIYTVSDNSNTAVVSASIVGSKLYLTFLPDKNGSAAVTVTATDSAGISVSDILTVNVAAENDAPEILLTDHNGLTTVLVTAPPPVVSTLDNVAFNFDAAHDALLSVADVDVDEATPDNTAKISLMVSHGTLSMANVPADSLIEFTGTLAAINNKLNSLTYTPNTGYDQTTDGPEALVFVVDDLGHSPAIAKTATVTIPITVVAVNDAPVAQDVSAVASEDGPSVKVNLIADDVDKDDDPASLVYSIVSTVNEGTLVNNNDGSFQFDPGSAFQDLGPGETRIVTFQYKATDSHGLDSNVATGRITVHGVNDAPVAVDDTFAVQRNTTRTVAVPGVKANDSDADGDTLTVILVSGTSNGTLTLRADGSFTYTPQTNYTGSDTFRYKLNDGSVDSATATVTLNIGYPPVARNDSVSAVMDTPKVISVLANDNDPDGALDAATVTIVTPPSHGTAVVNASGTITYTPATGYLGGDSLSYKVADNSGFFSNTASVTIQVNTPHPWQNPSNAFDVNNDGTIAPIDVLLVVNELNRRGSVELPNPPLPPQVPPPYLDVDGDENLSPRDALLIINYLNSLVSGGEGESGAGAEGEGSTASLSTQNVGALFTNALADSPVVVVDHWMYVSASEDGSGHSDAILQSDVDAYSRGGSLVIDDVLDDITGDVVKHHDSQDEYDAIFGSGLLSDL